MIIKKTPEDFVVREVLQAPPRTQEGPFRLFLLEKRGWNTRDAMKALADRTKVPLREIRAAGQKDKNARTAQHLSVPARFDLTCSGDGFSVSFAGYGDAPLGHPSLRGNRFDVVLRNMGKREAASAERRLLETADRGFINYFGDQRFGAVGQGGEFLAEMLVKRLYGPALRKYLSACHPEAPVAVKRRKSLVAERWGRWDEVASLCDEPHLKKMAEILRAKGAAGFRACLALIPADEMGMHFSAYSSFLWNETLSRFLADQKGALFPVRLRTGEVLQFRSLDETLALRLRTEPLATVAPDMPALPEDMGEVFLRLLAERGVRLSKFRLKEIPQAYFASFPRACLVVPEDLSVAREEDALYQGRFALRAGFFLPRGSYGTVLLGVL